MSSGLSRQGRLAAYENAGDNQPVGYVIVTLVFRQEGNVWTGECRELGTATYAPTLQKVEDELGELVMLHVNALEDLGERERFFKTNGIKFHRLNEEPESSVRREIPVDDAFVQARRVLVLPARRVLVGSTA